MYADLSLDPLIQVEVTAADYGVRLNTYASQLAYAVLCGLGFQFARGRNVGQERQMDVVDVVLADLVTHLANRLEKWQALDVAHRTANLNDYHLGS